MTFFRYTFIMNNFKTLLQKQGLKATTQRMSLLGSIEMAGHIDIENLYRAMTHKHPSLSLNTVYLNLEHLGKKGIITKVALDSTKDVYEITKEAHAHQICSICGHVEDMSMPHNISHFFTDSIKPAFKPSYVSVSIYGVCESCAKNQTRSSHKGDMHEKILNITL